MQVCISAAANRGSGQGLCTASLLRDLEGVHSAVQRHNQAASNAERNQGRETITGRMREFAHAGRTPLAADLLLDCDLRHSHDVAHEMERAASALLFMTRHPNGEPAWRDYHAVFSSELRK